MNYGFKTIEVNIFGGTRENGLLMKIEIVMKIKMSAVVAS